MTAALTIADEGFDVYLVEKEDDLGGNVRHIHSTAEGANPQQHLKQLIKRVECHERIAIHKNTQVVKFGGHVGDYWAVLETAGNGHGPFVQKIWFGVVIVATGAHEHRGTEYLLGQDPRVVTQLQLEGWMLDNPEAVRDLNTVVMIQCVRYYAERADYCSRTCCTNTMKNAIAIKRLNPDCQVYVLYKDLITYGFRERYYTEARRLGVLFLRYTDRHKPDVRVVNERLQVTVDELILGDKLVLTPDVLALSVATEPAETNQQLAEMLGVPLSSEGFFMEAHLKLRPMDFIPEGMYLCGAAHYPKFMEESISHALATAGRAMTILSKDKLEVGGVVAHVDQSKCVACLTCVRTCPFGVPAIDPAAIGNGGIVGAAYIEEAKCQGCGTCTSECPAKAITLANYSDAQVMVPEAGALGAWRVN